MNKLFALVILSLLWVSCDTNSDTLFKQVPQSRSNIDFSNTLKKNSQFNIIEYLYYYNGSGVAIGDVNNDGLMDIYLGSNQEANKLYLNKGNLEFEDITISAGVAGEGYWTTGVNMADVNDDGWVDIYVCQLGDYKYARGRNQLFVNNGDLTFTESAKEYGLGFKGFSTQSVFFDYDKDNDLDMFLLNHAVHTRRSYGDTTLRYERGLQSGDRLYRNDSEEDYNFFTDVTDSSGIFRSVIGYGLGVTVADINQDTWPDLYVSNDFHEDDYLYLNNGNGTFTESLKKFIPHTSRFSMGNNIADINNDGLLDIMSLDMLADDESVWKKSAGEESNNVSNIKLSYGYHPQLARNTLQLNLGNGHFSDIALLTKTFATDWSWSPLLADFDNDGKTDIFISNGVYRRPNNLDYINYSNSASQKLYRQFSKDTVDQALIALMPSEAVSNRAFRQNASLSFEDATKEWGLDQPLFSNGAAYADLDNDGDLDLIVNNLEQPVSLFENRTEKLGNNFLQFIVKGPDGNSMAYGTKIRIKMPGERKIIQEIYPSRGFLSSVDPRVTVGIGKLEAVDTIEVIWPNGDLQILTEVLANTTLDLSYEENRFEKIATRSKEPQYFESAYESAFEFSHQENNFEDFEQDFLIPHKLSTQGPKLAVADLNNDGLDDVFIGGARNQPGAILFQNTKGVFVNSSQQLLAQDSLYEDVDATFLDADADGDLDLYVVSGGNEPDRELLHDRLYFNDKGVFHRKVLMEQSQNGSCVEPFDYDADGDIDLFIGNRSISGSYGLPPASYLLKNDGQGNFEDVSNDVAPMLSSLGMVSDAVWSDYNQDGFIDLIVVGEWMPVTILENNGTSFRDVHMEKGLSKSRGWWNVITQKDMDGDGDDDFVLGNLGLNAKVKASAEHPLRMYLKDFDQNGQVDPIICRFREGYYTPIANILELSQQVQFLRRRFTTFQSYAETEGINDILTEEELQGTTILEADELRSCWLENTAEGFELHPLPVETQFAPVYSILVDDFDEKPGLDMVLGGNLFDARTDYGRYDSSYGWYLQNTGDGEFKALKPSESGFFMTGQVRDMKYIKSAQGNYILIARNDDKPLVFDILYENKKIGTY